MHSLLKGITENVPQIFLLVRECMLLFNVVLVVTAMGLAIDSLVIATKTYLHINQDYVISNGPYLEAQEMAWIDEEIVFSII